MKKFLVAAIAATALVGPMAGVTWATGKPDACPASQQIPVYNNGNNQNHHYICAGDLPAGPKGEQGEQGPKGDTGPQGPKGDPGKDGVDGTDGTNGVDGLPGKDGVDGEDGAPGKDGTNGVDGLPGAPGAPGEQGPAGPQGPQGEQGEATSSTGAQGVPGPQGPAGKDGVTKTVIVENGEETEVGGLPNTGQGNTLEVVLIGLGLLVIGTAVVYYLRNRG